MGYFPCSCSCAPALLLVGFQLELIFFAFSSSSPSTARTLHVSSALIQVPVSKVRPPPLARDGKVLPPPSSSSTS
eukprot:767484-Hanusia_phi.AAC.2